jgi:hypothetical protein
MFRKISISLLFLLITGGLLIHAEQAKQKEQSEVPPQESGSQQESGPSGDKVVDSEDYKVK